MTQKGSSSKGLGVDGLLKYIMYDDNNYDVNWYVNDDNGGSCGCCISECDDDDDVDDVVDDNDDDEDNEAGNDSEAYSDTRNRKCVARYKLLCYTIHNTFYKLQCT